MRAASASRTRCLSARLGAKTTSWETVAPRISVASADAIPAATSVRSWLAAAPVRGAGSVVATSAGAMRSSSWPGASSTGGSGAGASNSPTSACACAACSCSTNGDATRMISAIAGDAGSS